MDSDNSLDRDARLGRDHVATVALTLLLGGSVIALVGQHTAAQAGPAIVLSLLLAALGTLPLLCCLHVLNPLLPVDGLLGLLRAGSGRASAGLLGGMLLLELVATSAGAAQSLASHLRVFLLRCGIDAGNAMPDQLAAVFGLLLLGVVGLLPPRRVVLAACALLTMKIGIGLLLLALAARYVHYAYWIPWLPEATAPYRFGLGGVLAASVPLLGVFASVGLALGFPGMGRQERARTMPLLAGMLLLAMLLLIVLAALQAGLVEFPALASTRPLSVALQQHPQLHWMMPLLPLAGAAGLAALLLVVMRVAARLAAQLWPAASHAVAGLRARLAWCVVVASAAVLALLLPVGTLPVLPGPATLLVMAALCLTVLRVQAPPSRVLLVLAPVAAALCVLAAVERMRVWPG
ncbi:amino acid transporter [Stenotrophomonas maltophilia]|uniref:amino acid transporter n=1 Tax=Stenotrophomonas maltophilia TaxID=40324 RepID=UPI0012AF87BF|nr:amino acid transporter [Stenotrophomonas maltophilia]ELC7365174.1 amino acid transporter [Stenotrophomonas maltophilia]MBA0253284.1 amino acid transporter [Stenotrophomonas maltophilia]MBA0321176.1 amino acid transporter [Stenotrophomonas maltophilia]MBH1629504.1 amino acid transporter [Stenotrophomonas maltophilia]MCU1142784.1 amino acid transporter [Stenotrophomonas maltophilia]